MVSVEGGGEMARDEGGGSAHVCARAGRSRSKSTLSSPSERLGHTHTHRRSKTNEEAEANTRARQQAQQTPSDWRAGPRKDTGTRRKSPDIFLASASAPVCSPSDRRAGPAALRADEGGAAASLRSHLSGPRLGDPAHHRPIAGSAEEDREKIRTREGFDFPG